MSTQLHDNATNLESDDGARVEDSFRRAAFNWAIATKRLAESSAALGVNTRVPYAALVDIEYARDNLDGLFIPKVAKVPAGSTEKPTNITAESVRNCVSGLATRMVTLPVGESSKPKAKVHHSTDLSAPVHSKNGKMLWADVHCPACPSMANQRCQRDDGAFLEKPHPQRKSISEQA